MGSRTEMADTEPKERIPGETGDASVPPEEVPQTDVLEDEVLHFSVMMRRRASIPEKEQALAYLDGRLRDSGIKPAFGRVSEEGMNVAYGVAGDLTTAKNVVVVPFDTPSRCFVPGYRFRPFDEEANKRSELLNILLKIIGVALPCAVIDLTMLLVLGLSVWFITAVDALILLLALGLVKNDHNANKSSVALAVATTLAIELLGDADPAQGDHDCAFLFVDHCAESMSGFSVIARHMESLKTKNVFFLDCLASGAHLLLAHSDGHPVRRTNSLLEDHVVESGSFAVFRTLPELRIICRADTDSEGLYFPNVRTESDFDVNIEVARVAHDAMLDLLTHDELL